MNIAVDIRSLTNHKKTGVGNYVYYALKHILQLDHENHYFLLTTGWRRYQLPEALRQPNVQHTHIRIPNKIFTLKLLLKVGRPLDAYLPQKVDLYWLPNLNFYKFSDQVKIIFTVHDLSFMHLHNFYSWKMRIWHWLIRIKRIIYKSYKVIAVSQSTQREIMRRLTVSADKIRTIYPGVNVVPLDDQAAGLLLENLHLPEKYFIFLGTLEPRKNIMSIIQAFDHLQPEHPDYGLVLVGARGWIFRKSLKEIKARHYIRYFGYIKSPAKDALFYRSAGLIWPSFYEGFGFPPLEATFYRKPVICSYKTSLPEIMQQQALYVDPYNSREIYYLLKNLIEDQNLHRQFTASAQDFVVPNWPTQAREIINLFKECA